LIVNVNLDVNIIAVNIVVASRVIGAGVLTQTNMEVAMRSQGDNMRYRSLIGAIALAALAMPTGSAQAFDDSKYPNLKGQWNRVAICGLAGQASFDQTKPWGFGQEAPLTPEYKAVLEASLADQAKGGQGNATGYGCRAHGMPMMMQAFLPQEYVITPDTT